MNQSCNKEKENESGNAHTYNPSSQDAEAGR